MILKVNSKQTQAKTPPAAMLTVPGISEIDSKNVIVSTIFDYNIGMPIPKDRYTKWFDYDKIDKVLWFRTRQTKDYLIIDENGNKQKLKSYMINEKIPENQRANCPLIAMEEHVIWLIGYRISSALKVTEETKKILEIRYLGGENSGRNNQSYDF